MSYQQYERVSLVENGVPLDEHDPSYFTGIPNTAPPSFRSIASSINHRRNPPSPHQSSAVHESDESSVGEDPGISLWGGSSMDAESVRENTITLLMNRVEMLESRLEEQQPLADKEEIDVEALVEKKRRDFWMTVGITIAVIVFSFWFMAVILLSVWAKVEYARHAGQLRDNNAL